jgi:hypothetical protein
MPKPVAARGDLDGEVDLAFQMGFIVTNLVFGIRLPGCEVRTC